jgi:Na+-driven multidrug efflux pump
MSKTPRERARERLHDGPMFAALFHIGWPVLLASIANALSSSVILFWLSYFLGSGGLSSQTVLGPIRMVVVWINFALSAGMSVAVGRAVGSGDRTGMAAVTNASMMAAVLNGALAGIALLGLPWVLSALAGPLADDASVRAYVVPWLVSLPFLALSQILIEAVNATGRTTFGLIRNIANLVLLALLVPAFIHLLGLGTGGAPAAQGVASLLLALWIGRALFRRDDAAGIGAFEVSLRAFFDLSAWREMLAVGLPAQLGRIAYFLAQGVLIRIVARDGQSSVAGYGVAENILFYALMVTLALSRAAGIFLAQAIGAGLRGRALSCIKHTLAIAAASGLVFVAALSAAPLAIRLYTSDAAVIDAAKRAIQLMGPGLLVTGVNQCLLAAYTSAKRTKAPGAAFVVCEILGVVYASTFQGAGLEAAAGAFSFSAVLETMILGLLFRRSFTSALPPTDAVDLAPRRSA